MIQLSEAFIAEYMAVSFGTRYRIFVRISIVIGIFLLGVFSDRLINYYFSSSIFPAPVRQHGYTYISPLLYCRYPNPDKSKLISSLKNNLQRYTDDATTQGKMQSVSVFFHDPTNGEWMSINGTAQYAIASLVKVPLFMIIYNQAENDPTLLKKKLPYTGPNADEDENFKPAPQLEMKPGQSYSIDDLINRMIINSDNNAMNLLTSQIKLQEFNDSLEQLNFSPIQGNAQSDITMTVGKYASFFRILYNATYLNPEMSERALKLLTKTTFTKGLVAGVPKAIPVAHKFGERAYDDSSTKELHDCGIVYYPKHPYLLCVMTKGNDFASLESVIQTISTKTFDEVKATYQ